MTPKWARAGRILATSICCVVLATSSQAAPANNPGAGIECVEEMRAVARPNDLSGALGVTMRLYAPKPAVLSGEWNPPAIKRLR